MTSTFLHERLAPVTPAHRMFDPAALPVAPIAGDEDELEDDDFAWDEDEGDQVPGKDFGEIAEDEDDIDDDDVDDDEL